MTTSTDTIRVAIAYHSGFGHTTRQAEAVARGAASVPGTVVELLNVTELTDALWAALDRADAIIFGAPTYMGSPSAVFKTFADGTARAWADNLRWKDKIAAGFTKRHRKYSIATPILGRPASAALRGSERATRGVSAAEGRAARRKW
jgi:multimeric flavodoxin WrbA